MASNNHPETIELQPKQTSFAPQDSPNAKRSSVSQWDSNELRHRSHWGTVRTQIYLEDDSRRQKTLNKWVEATKELKGNVANWFGVADETESNRLQTMQKWSMHVQRMHAHSKLLGGYKEHRRIDTPDSVFEHSSGMPSPAVFSALPNFPTKTPQPYDPLARGHRQLASRQTSRISIGSMGRRAGRVQTLARRPEKESVFKMAYDGVKNIVTSANTTKKPALHCRSVTPHQMTKCDVQTPGSVFHSEDSYLDDVFFDTPVPTSAAIVSDVQPRLVPRFNETDGFHATDSVRATDGSAADRLSAPSEKSGIYYDLPAPGSDSFPVKPGWQQGRAKPSPGFAETPNPDVQLTRFEGMSRMPETVTDELYENSNKRKIGIGFPGFLTEAQYRKSRIDSDIRHQISEMEDHRPFFTFWVTFVQIVCYIIAVFAYDLAPIGLSQTKVSAEILMPNLAIEESSYMEEDNLWVGLRQADLIHFGAKYSPCMRSDVNVMKNIQADRMKEEGTGCCIRIDGSGCYQTLEQNCSYRMGREHRKSTLTKFKSWTNGTGPYGRKSGAVCHQDPRYCKSPHSPHGSQYDWPDDITKWPQCLEQIASELLPRNDSDHMTCDITGRPCCVGIQGECLITTREDCQFRRGYYHQNQTLCSQVSCIEEICGMIPFLDPEKPDQFFRLFISLFIHAGVLQLFVTVLFQLTVMRDLEKLAGSVRIGIIYMTSGVAGSLASAIFLPYHVEAGPSGSQFGLLACVFVEIIQNWYILTHPGLALLKLGLVLVVLFIIGLLPMVDNYAHLIGFIFGFLLSFAFLPYITFNIVDKRGKMIGIVVCMLASLGLFTGLIILFYVAPIYECPMCHYFNCIPLTTTFCKSMEVAIRRN